MNAVLNLGKYLFAIPFFIFGLFHFMNASAMAGMAPGGVIMVYIAGAALIAAAVSIIIGKLDKLACVLLALLMIIFIVAVHVPGMMAEGADESAKQMAMMSILKDMALAGGALLCAKLAKDKSIIG